MTSEMNKVLLIGRVAGKVARIDDGPVDVRLDVVTTRMSVVKQQECHRCLIQAGSLAEMVLEFVQPGMLVYVEGEHRPSTGAGYEILVKNIHFLGKPAVGKEIGQ